MFDSTFKTLPTVDGDLFPTKLNGQCNFLFINRDSLRVVTRNSDVYLLLKNDEKCVSEKKD